MSYPDRYRLFSHMIQSRFLHIEDALSQDKPKLRFFIGSFERGQGANATAYAFLDLDEARVILNDMSWSKPVDVTLYSGGKDSNGQVISRVLKIKTNTEEGKVWVELHNGKGEESFGGIVKPLGKPWAEVSIPLTIHESRKMAFACLAYIHAWEVARMVAAQIPIRTGALRN